MPAGIRTSSVIVLLAAAALLPPAAPAASFVYNFKNTDNSYALEWETPVLLPPDLRYQTVSRNSMNYCIQGGAPCSFAVFSTSFGSFEESFDAVLFGVETGGLFPQTSLTRTGAALTIQNSPLDGRVVIFQNLGDDLYEYFFKDSTGTRTFTYRAPRPLLSDIDLPIGALTDCSSPTGPCFSPISIRLDFTFFETFDMLTLIENGVSRIYAFPRLSFNRFGTVSTLPGAEQGTLVVRRVRTDGTPAPDDPIDPPPPPPPSEVPEPATVAAVAAGLAALALRRRRPRGLGLLALALAASSVASAASFVYYYEDRTRERNRFQWETSRLLGENPAAIDPSELDFCQLGGRDCSTFVLLDPGSSDLVAFGDSQGALFPRDSLRRPGAALTLPNSPVNAKLVVYPHSDDFLWEYYFKDGPRVFTYRTPRPILADVFIPISALESCTVATGPCSDLIHFNADYLGNSDMVMFREGFVQRLFTFPRLSLSREGEFRSGSASLTVRRIRDLRGTPAVPGDSTAPNLPPSGLPTPGGGTPTVPGGGTNPGEHPSEVPEPATFVLAAAGLAALALRRRVRQVPR